MLIALKRQIADLVLHQVDLQSGRQLRLGIVILTCILEHGILEYARVGIQSKANSSPAGFYALDPDIVHVSTRVIGQFSVATLEYAQVERVTLYFAH